MDTMSTSLSGMSVDVDTMSTSLSGGVDVDMMSTSLSGGECRHGHHVY